MSPATGRMEFLWNSFFSSLVLSHKTKTKSLRWTAPASGGSICWRVILFRPCTECFTTPYRISRGLNSARHGSCGKWHTPKEAPSSIIIKHVVLILNKRDLYPPSSPSIGNSIVGRLVIESVATFHDPTRPYCAWMWMAAMPRWEKTVFLGDKRFPSIKTSPPPSHRSLVNRKSNCRQRRFMPRNGWFRCRKHWQPMRGFTGWRCFYVGQLDDGCFSEENPFFFIKFNDIKHSCAKISFFNIAKYPLSKCKTYKIPRSILP